MKALINQYVKLGTVFLVSYPECEKDASEYLKHIRKIVLDTEFDAIEITHIENKELRNHVRELMKESGMTVAYCAQPLILKNGWNLNSLDRQKRNMAIKKMKLCIDEAYEIEAESLSFLAGTYDEETKGRAFDCLAESVAQLCGYAKERGDLQIELEIFDYDLDKCSLIGPSRFAAKLAEKICKEHQNFWLLPDLSHIPQQHETSSESLKWVLPYMRRMHIGNCIIQNDNPAFGDQHPPFHYPNSCIGVKEIKEFLQLLLDNKMLNIMTRPMLSFEVKPREGEDPDCVLAMNKRILRQAWSLTEERE